MSPVIPLKEYTILHSRYLESVGRALLVSQHIEALASHVMTIVAVTDRMQEDENYTSADLGEVALALRSWSLGRHVRGLEAAGDFGEDGPTLIAAKEARNWLAHEATDRLQVSGDLDDLIVEVAEFLRNARVLCEADRLLAKATAEISERESMPGGLRTYARDLHQPVLFTRGNSRG